MSGLVLGVIGHVDHGKTALVRALTGMETDRLAEERQRGISIVLGFAHTAIGPAVVDLVDMPGHERFVRTMVSGATGIDAALLVVAANEGVMPQTREHVHIAGLLGLRRAVVAVTKADLVPAAQAERAGRDAAGIAAAAGLEAEAVVLTSAASGAGLDALRAAIAALAGRVPPRPDVGLPFLPVDRAFSLVGHGTVVTGTLRRGGLAVGQEVALAPGGGSARIRGLQVHGAPVRAAAPGQRVAANLRGVELGEVGRGTALVSAGTLGPSRWLTVELRSVAEAALRTTAVLRLLAGTSETDVRLRLLDRDELRPGDTALAQLHAAAALVLPGRERFILRTASPPATVAGGLVLDPQARRLRRHAPSVLAEAAALAACDPAAAPAQWVAAAGPAGLSVERFARLAGIGRGHAAALLRAPDVVLCGGEVAVLRGTLDGVRSQVEALLAREDQAVPRDRVLAGVPGAAAAVADAVLSELVASGRVRREPAGYRRVQADRDRQRRTEQQALAAEIAERLRQGGLAPPDIATLARDAESRRVLDRLVKEGVAVRGRDSGMNRDMLFHRDAAEQAQAVLLPLLASGPGLRVGEVAAALGVTRKHCLPLLDYLDSIRFTRRVGDRRQLQA